MKNAIALIAGIWLAATAGADTPAKKKPAMDFSVGDLGDLPKADGLQNHTGDDAPKLDEPTAAPTKATYTLAKVVHCQQLIQKGDSYEARQPITKIEVSNLPMIVAGFHTWIRVHSPEKRGASVKARLADPLNHTIAESEGDLVFGTKTDTDFVVDWTSLELRRPGIYKIEVTVGDEKVGESPIPVVQELRATLSETAPDGGS